MWLRICLVRGIKIPLENSLWRWREWRWLWWWWRLWWFSWKYQASRQTEPATKVGPTGRAPLVHPKLKTNNISQNTYTLHKNLGSTPPPCWSKRPFSVFTHPIMNDENKYHSFCALDMQQKCQNDKSYYFFLICFLTDDFFHSIELHNWEVMGTAQSSLVSASNKQDLKTNSQMRLPYFCFSYYLHYVYYVKYFYYLHQSYELSSL